MGGGKVISARGALLRLFAWRVILSSALMIMPGLCLAMAGDSLAPDGPGGAPDSDPSALLQQRPDTSSLMAAYGQSGLSEVSAVARIGFDEKGVVRSAKLDPATGVRALDDAILDWARKARFRSGTAGTVVLPFRFGPEMGGPGDAREIPIIDVIRLQFRPSMAPIINAVMAANLDRMDAEVEIDYDEQGVVTAVRLIESSGRTRLDKAILDWARQARLGAGAAGTGRLPFKFDLK